MRISTVTMYEQSINSLNRQQGDFLKVGQQIATGRRVVNPSDDPQAASRAVAVSQAKAVTQQYADSRISARNTLAQTESVLNSVGDAITSAKTLLVQAASDTLSDADRQSVASELRGVYETLIGQANATDGNGRYLFGGYRDDAPPFARTESGDGRAAVINYQGDENSRAQRIDASREMSVTENGLNIFQSVPSGAGFVARAERDDGARNEGSLTFTSGPSRVDPSADGFGQPFTLAFTVDEDSGEPSVRATAADGSELLVEGPFTSGQSLTVAGVSITLQGTPADGDAIQVRPANAPEANQDLFRSLREAIDVLEMDQEGTAENRALFRNTINTVMRELDNNLDNVLTVRASVGARLNELDVVDSVAGNRMLNYEQTLSDLIDLDYAQAISEYSLRQVGLQAAQKAFVDIKSMSLFDYLR